MNESRHRPGVVGPLMLITAGILLLLNQMGRLPWDLWGTLWRFWPVIFILIGVDILASASRSNLVYILSLIVALAIIGGVIGYAVWHGGELLEPGESAMGSEAVLETLHDASSAHITLKPGVAHTEVSALSDSPNLVEGTIEYGRYSLKTNKSLDIVNGQAELLLQARSRNVRFWPSSSDVSEHWSLRFTPRIPLEFTVDAGVGNLDIDLSDLIITRLDLNAGVGNTTVTFPTAAGTTRASIDAGVGNIHVRIPNGVGAKVHVSKGLGNVRVRNTHLSGDDRNYISSDFEIAQNKLELEISGGIGNITIE